MFLLVGLGNPGSEYELTRHNIGFIILDYLADKLGANFSKNSKMSGEVAKTDFEGNKLILLKPTTFMNLSGNSVLAVANYYKIPEEKIIVFYDELELSFSKVKIKAGGGAAGHNGIKSLNSHTKNIYSKFRFGIGRPEHGDVSNYVLSRFSSQELAVIERVLPKIHDGLGLILDGKKDKFLNML